MPDASKILACGPAGWSYPQWDAIVYPRPKPKSFHPLEYLARFFDLVEINTSFHQRLRPEATQVWLAKVSANPRFRFTAKLHRQFTHDRRLEEREVAAFSGGLRPLHRAGKLGCLLMQFPWSFRFTAENRDFLIRLRRAFAEFPLVAEVRHASWLREEALGVFIDYHIGFCNIDQPRRTNCLPPTAYLTSPVGYVRLHGRDYGSWFQGFQEQPGRGDYLYSAEELAEWRDRIARIRQFAAATDVVTTTDAQGRSVANALQMQALLGRTTELAPATLMKFYRQELDAFRPDRPVQPLLFQSAPDQRRVA